MARRKARRRWNRSTIIWCVLGVILIHVGIGAVIEAKCPDLRDPVFARKAKQLAQRRAEFPGRPLLLAMGSSRTLMGLDAGRLTHSDDNCLLYNFGELGAGPMLEQIFLRRLIASGVRPDALLIELAPAQFASRIGLTAETAGMNLGRLDWRELNQLAPYHDHPLFARGRWLKGRLLITDGNQQAIHDELGVDAPLELISIGDVTDPFGFSTYQVPTPEARAEGIRGHVERYGPRLANASISEGAARATCDLVELCRREHVPFSFVLMPEVSALRALYPPSFLADFDRFLTDMRRGGDFDLIDARTWIADDGFWDAHHLHVDGSKQFSDRLAAQALPELKRRALKKIPSTISGNDARVQNQRNVTAP